MAIHASLTETDDILIWSSYTDTVGDVGDMSQSTYEHHMLIGAGKVEVREEGKDPWIIAAPGILIVPTGVNITLEALEVPVIIYCIYNKLTAGSLDDVRTLVDEMRKRNEGLVGEIGERGR